MDRMQPELARAILHWKRGLPIPLDLYAELRQLGLNVERLEQKYRNN